MEQLLSGTEPVAAQDREPWEKGIESAAPWLAWLSAQVKLRFHWAPEEETTVPNCRKVWNLQARIAKGKPQKFLWGFTELAARWGWMLKGDARGHAATGDTGVSAQLE